MITLKNYPLLVSHIVGWRKQSSFTYCWKERTRFFGTLVQSWQTVMFGSSKSISTKWDVGYSAIKKMLGAMELITSIPSCLSCRIFNQWIELKDLARLDSALCVKSLRPDFLNLLSSAECIVETQRKISSGRFLSWLLKRIVKVRYFYIPRNVDEELGVQYMKKHGSFVTRMVREMDYAQGGKSKDFGLKIVDQGLKHENLAYLECNDLSVVSMDEILSHCQSVRELNVGLSLEDKNAQTVTHHTPLSSVSDLYVSGNENIALSVISLCPNLRKLSFVAGLTDANAAKIAEKCRRLKFLRLCGMNPAAFAALTTVCTDIVNLDLSCATVTDDTMRSVAENLKHLRRLNLQYCHELTNASLHNLAFYRVATLEVLWLCGNFHITSEAVLVLKSKLPILYVHYQYTLDPQTVKPSDFAVCTELEFNGSMLDFLSIAAQFTAVAVLCFFDRHPTGVITETMTKIMLSLPHVHTVLTNKRDVPAVSFFDRHPTGVITETMTKIMLSLPHVHTVLTNKRDVPAVKSALNSVGRKITVTCDSACLDVNLHDFPV